MACSCISGNSWNYNIQIIDTKTLLYSDFSKWNEEEPYILPSSHEVKFTINGKVATIEVAPKGHTIITSKDLGFGNSCIEDSIVCIEAYSCKSCNDDTWGEKKFTKQEAILPQSKCKVDNLRATGSDKANKMSSKLKQIEGVSKIGQTSKAADLYKIFSRELEKLNCSSCC